MTTNDSDPESRPKKRSKSKPLTLHPLTVEEALQRTLAAGPLPEKQNSLKQKSDPTKRTRKSKKPRSDK